MQPRDQLFNVCRDHLEKRNQTTHADWDTFELDQEALLLTEALLKRFKFYPLDSTLHAVPL